MSLHPFLRDRTVQMTALLTLIMLVGPLILLHIRSAILPAQVPLWYTLPISSRLAPVLYLWYLPTATACLWLVNTMIGFLLFRRAPLVAQILGWSTLLLAGMVATMIIRTILIYSSPL